MANTKTTTRRVPIEATRFAAVNSWKFGEASKDEPGVPVTLLARTGGAMSHPYWGDIYHDMEGLTVHKDRLVIDYIHDDAEILGYLDTFDATPEGLTVQGRLVPFTADDRAAEVIHKAQNGVPYEASIFFSEPVKIEELDKGVSAEVNGKSINGPATIFRQWALRAVAVCPHGMDRNAATKLAATAPAEISVIMTNKQEPAMTENDKPGPAQDGEAAAVETVLADEPAGKDSKAAVPAKTEAPVDEPAAIPPADPSDPDSAEMLARTKCAGYIKAFGPDGAAWFAEGLSFEKAALKALADARAELAEAKALLAAARTGEAEPLSADPASGGGNSDLSRGQNEGIAALVARNKEFIGSKR